MPETDLLPLVETVNAISLKRGQAKPQLTTQNLCIRSISTSVQPDLSMKQQTLVRLIKKLPLPQCNAKSQHLLKDEN